MIHFVFPVCVSFSIENTRQQFVSTWRIIHFFSIWISSILHCLTVKNHIWARFIVAHHNSLQRNFVGFHFMCCIHRITVHWCTQSTSSQFMTAPNKLNKGVCTLCLYAMSYLLVKRNRTLKTHIRHFSNSAFDRGHSERIPSRKSKFKIGDKRAANTANEFMIILSINASM